MVWADHDPIKIQKFIIGLVLMNSRQWLQGKKNWNLFFDSIASKKWVFFLPRARKKRNFLNLLLSMHNNILAQNHL